MSKEAAEPMPKNVLDFKDHPYYALERHLKRGEVIHPKREAGKVAVGRNGGQQILEPIFRRRDVHIVKSADSWYRMGREIKVKCLPYLQETSFFNGCSLIGRRTTLETGSCTPKKGARSRR